MKIDYCFHSHTSRCGHATGTDEMYVTEAIKNGVKELGFSDHVFLPGKHQPGVRGDFSKLTDYKNSVYSLKEKYKDQVNIYLGFECEYYDEFVDYYKSLLEKEGFDYLILGQHFFMNDGNFFYYRNDLSIENAKRYLREVEKAMKTGLFLYFAHPDLCLTIFDSFDKDAERISREICKLAKKYDIPLELNLNGMTWSLPRTMGYPNINFWKVVGEEGNKVCIGYDAHQPEFYSKQVYVKLALEWAKKFKLNLITKKELLKRINKKVSS